MRRFVTSIGFILLALIPSAPVALAQANSTSFMLTDDLGGYANDGGADSSTFGGDNGGLTWYQGELTGNSFTLSDSELTTGGGTSGSTGGSTGGGTTGGTSGGDGSDTAEGGSGGGRYDGAVSSSSIAPGTQSSSSSSAKPRPPRQPRSSAASSDSGVTDVVTREAFEQRLDLQDALISDALRRAAERRASRAEIRFFDATDPVCPPSMRAAAPHTDDSIVELWLAAFILVFTLLGWALTVMRSKRIWTFLRTKKNRAIVGGTLLVLAGVLSGLILLGIPGVAYANNNTVPNLRIYKGTLRTPSGTAITTPVTLRFSYWNTSDYVTTDTTATGSLNTGAASYLGWYEVHTVTPNVNGAFSVVLGQTRPLVNLKTTSASNLLSLHLQVEAKNSTAPETAYELLDINTSSTTIDRSQILAVPLARNADLLDQRDTGTGAFDIPVLNSLGKLPVSTVPLGTNHDSFMVDADASSTGSISLRFGTGLASQLQYDTVTSKFNFLSNVSIQGDLTVTGLINGVNIGSIASSTGALKAVAGAGLNLKVSAGSYRLNGAVTNSPGNGGVAMPASSTVYVFFGSGGLTSRTIGFPTDESYIPVAQVTTDGSGITGIDDRRVLSSDDRETNVEAVFYPDYQNASYQGDGANNVGQLVVGHDSINKQNFYQWTSTRPDLQDYDILLKARVPSGFTRWQTGGFSNALAVQYRSTSSGTSIAKLDIQVYDTNGTPVTLSGSAVNLNGLTWQTTGLEFSGGTWTPGQDFLIRLRMHAKDSFQMHVGSLKLRYVDFKQPE